MAPLRGTLIGARGPAFSVGGWSWCWRDAEEIAGQRRPWLDSFCRGSRANGPSSSRHCWFPPGGGGCCCPPPGLFWADIALLWRNWALTCWCPPLPPPPPPRFPQDKSINLFLKQIFVVCMFLLVFLVWSFFLVTAAAILVCFVTICRPMPTSWDAKWFFLLMARRLWLVCHAWLTRSGYCRGVVYFRSYSEICNQI